MTKYEYWIGEGTDYQAVWRAYEDGRGYIEKFFSMRVHLLRIELALFPADQPLFNHEAVYKTIKGYFHDFKKHCLSHNEYVSAGPLFLYSVDRGSGIWNFLGEPRQLIAFGATLAEGKILGQELENIGRKLEILQKFFPGVVNPEDLKNFMYARTPKELQIAVEKLMAQGIQRVEVSRQPFDGDIENTAKSLVDLGRLMRTALNLGGYMTGLEIVSALAAAFKIVKDSPGAIKVLLDLGVSAGLLEKEVQKAPPPIEIDETQPAGILTKGLFDELNDLSREYNAKKGTWNQVDRESHQRIVAARACELMKSGEDLLKGIVKSFDVLKKFFCKVAGEQGV